MFSKFKPHIIVLYCYSCPTGIRYDYKVIIFPITHGLNRNLKTMHDVGEIWLYALQKYNYFDNKRIPTMEWLEFETVI